jgi:hypothetical protein
MIKIGSGSYETPKEAGYTYLSYNPDTKEHTLLNNDTNKKEIFISCKSFAGWALIYKNTHLEFCRTIQ